MKDNGLIKAYEAKLIEEKREKTSYLMAILLVLMVEDGSCRCGALADGPGGQVWLDPTAICVGVGHVEVVDMLLNAGASVDHAGKGGVTPVLIASYEGHDNVVDILVNAGAGCEPEGQ